MKVCEAPTMRLVFVALALSGFGCATGADSGRRFSPGHRADTIRYRDHRDYDALVRLAAVIQVGTSEEHVESLLGTPDFCMLNDCYYSSNRLGSEAGIKTFVVHYTSAPSPDEGSRPAVETVSWV